MWKKGLIISLAALLALSLSACAFFGETETQTGSRTQTADAAQTSADAADRFSSRDLTQEADLDGAVTVTVQSGEEVQITSDGVYVLEGTAENVTVTVEAGDEDKVQLVLNGVSITNADFPCIYVKNADKVFVTTTAGSENTLTVTGSFRKDGSTTTDAVIFSRDDLVLNGLGTLTVRSSDNGISGKDEIKITGGTVNVTCASDAIEANDAILMAGGVVTVDSEKDGLHAENDDETVGEIWIGGGTLTVAADDDAIHAVCTVQIDGGTLDLTAREGVESTQIRINAGEITIAASDDGLNGGQKTKTLGVLIEINGGSLTITMGQGDTDGVDSNGDLTITGGTVSVTGQSAFDCDGTLTWTGGTVYVNGQQVTELTNQFGGMGGMGGMGGPGGMGGRP